MISRRGVIAGGTVAGAASLLPLPLLAQGTARLLLVDGSLAAADRVQVPAGGVHLEPELVAQWRRVLRQRFLDGERGIALVRWDKALLLSGLAREDRLVVRQRRLGRSLFAVEIG